MLLDLPDLCIQMISAHLVKGLMAGHHTVAVHAVSREAYRLFAHHLYEAVDRGCVEKLQESRLIQRTAIEHLQQIASSSHHELHEEDGSSFLPEPSLTWPIAKLRAACLDASMPKYGTKAVLLERIEMRRLEHRFMASVQVSSAREMLSDSVLTKEVHEYACPVRSRARTAVSVRRGALQLIGVAQAISMGLEHNVVRQLVPVRSPEVNIYAMQSRARRYMLYDLSSVSDALLAVHGPGETIGVRDPPLMAEFNTLCIARFQSVIHDHRMGVVKSMIKQEFPQIRIANLESAVLQIQIQRAIRKFASGRTSVMPLMRKLRILLGATTLDASYYGTPTVHHLKNLVF